MTKKIKPVKLSRIEKAILRLAAYMEDPMHDQYHICDEITDILGYEYIAPLPKRRKK